MKTIIKTLLLFSFLLLPAYGEESPGLIWDYRNDNFIESLKEGHGSYDELTKKDLDDQIKQGLDINLIPIDLSTCIYVAMENNYDIKI